EEPKQPKKKTRRGSRGGRGRKKKSTAATVAAAGENGAGAPDTIEQPVAKIHLPDRELDQPAEPEPEEQAAATDGAQPEKPKKKTRRGTRGGKSRRKKATVTAPDTEAAKDWTYVPMSEWVDDLSEK